MITLNQIFWKKDEGSKSFTIPVAINPKYILMAITDKVNNPLPIIGQETEEEATAVMIEGWPDPIMVRESLFEVLDMISHRQ